MKSCFNIYVLEMEGVSGLGKISGCCVDLSVSVSVAPECEIVLIILV